MTYTPGPLSALRDYLKPITGLDANALGIQHWTPDGGGYHEGWDLLRMGYGWGDYSVSESTRDTQPTNAASAIDVGDFSVIAFDRHVTLRDLSLWLVGQCKAGAADTVDIREIIYTPDGVNVRRWDRQGVRSSGDDSHLYHSHISYFRDAEGRDKVALFRRFFEGDDDMDYDWLNKRFADLWGREGYISKQATDVWTRVGEVGTRVDSLAAQVADQRTVINALAAAVNAGGGNVDVAAVLAKLDANATAIRSQLDEQHAEEMAALKADYDRQLAAKQAELDALRQPTG